MKIKRALLINPPSGLYRRDDRCQAKVEDQTAAVIFPPIELAYLAAVLEQIGIECRIRDYPAENCLWLDFQTDLTEFQPDLLIINATTPTLADDLKSAEIAKRLLPNIFVVARGEYFNIYHKKILSEYPSVDAVLRGEAELTVKELVEKDDLNDVLGITFRQNDKIIVNRTRPFLEDLDLLPFPARHLLKNQLYRSPENNLPITVIQTSRGCPYRCIFCAVGVSSGRKVRFRSPENVVTEVAECVYRFGIKNFLFNADTFTYNREWVISLCQKLIEKNLSPVIRWGANSRVDTVDKEMLTWMKKAGCWVIAFGVESGSQAMLDYMQKETTLDQARNAIKLAKSVGLKTHAFYLLGFPYETRENVIETLKFAKELDTDFFDVNIVYPLPGTPLANFITKHNLWEQLNGSKKASYAIAGIRTFYLTSGQLTKLRKKMLWRLYLRPAYIIRTLRNAGSIRNIYYYLRAGYHRAKNLLYLS